MFHEYAEGSFRRTRIPLFWENAQAHYGEGERSLRRALAAIGMAPGVDPASYTHAELTRYGVGHARPLALFYKLFLVDPVHRVANPLCPFVTAGAMHMEFQQHLRPDGLGIDYAYLERFDTWAEIDRIKASIKTWLKATGSGGDDDQTVLSFFSST